LSELLFLHAGEAVLRARGVGSVNHLTGEMFKSLAGIPDLVHVPYRGTGPATADAISGQVARAARTALAQRTYQQMLTESGFEPDTDSTPEKFRRLIEDDLARWAPLVKAIGSKLD
jgi:tripartite-type tricarboxylate transporter receptor subunit TctC